MSEGAILVGTVRMRAGVQEAAQFTPVHLIHQFTKLADHPLMKRRGFPAPYVAQTPRVPDCITECGMGSVSTAEGVNKRGHGVAS